MAAGHIWEEGSSVNIVFVSNQKIRALNRRYLGCDRSTDVIAFPASKVPGFMLLVGEKDAPFRGDIAISSDKALQNSGAYGVSIREELARYIIHGLLHLGGFEDTSQEKKEAMKKIEDRLVCKTEKIRQG